MPNNGNITIEELQIKISQESTNAVSGVEKFTQVLQQLKSVTAGGLRGLNSISKQIERFNTAVSSMPNLSRFKQLRDILAQIKGLGNIDISSIVTNSGNNNTTITSEAERIMHGSFTESGELGEMVSFGEDVRSKIETECQDILEDIKKYTGEIEEHKKRLEQALETKKGDFSSRTSFVSAETFDTVLTDKITSMRNQVDLLESQFAQYQESAIPPDEEHWKRFENRILSIRIAMQSLSGQTKRTAQTVENLGEETEKSNKSFGKFFISLKRIAVYRLIRSVLKSLANSVKEGIENISKFSETANEVMSQYKTESTYIKNSLGSAILPILQTLAPTIIRIGDALADVFNNFGMISSWIQGNKTFIKAKKYALDYAESLETVKKATTGFDEINTLSNVSKSEFEANNYTNMFESVDITGGGVAQAIGKITAAIAGLTVAFSILKGTGITGLFVGIGVSVASFFANLKGMVKWFNLKDIWKGYKPMERFTKSLTSILLVIGEFVAVRNLVSDMVLGTKSLGEGLLLLIPICIAVGLIMTNMWGFWGAVITLAVAAVAAWAGGMKAVSKKAKDREMKKFWDITGVSIEKATANLDGYLNSLGISKQQEWNDTLSEANEKLTDAIFSYNTLWKTIQGDTLSSKKIDELSEAFENLADAANEVNRAAIGGLMASIKTGIELNITPELTSRLSDLCNSLEVASDFFNSKVSGLNSRYQNILHEVENNGWNITPEQKSEMESLREELRKFTLTDNSDSISWGMALDSATKSMITAGFNKDDVKSSLDDLIKKRDEYLKILSDRYASDKSTLSQMIEKDRTEANGALGFKDSDLATLAESYNGQVKAVVEQFNNVIQGVYNGLNANAMKDPQTFWRDVSGWLPWNWGYYGTKDAYNEQQEILQMIADYKKNYEDLQVEIPAHANGGFVEDGLFMANHSELVGKFSNGRTAVANNEQIIEGIRQGVYDGMRDAGGNGGDWTIQIVDTNGTVRGETIISAAERKNRRDGRTVISVGG